MSKMTEFDIGDTVTLRVDFKVSGVLTDPTTITLSVADPSGNIDNYTYAGATVTRESTGAYLKSITGDEAGEWSATWTGTGACAASATRRFAVRRAGA